MRIKKIILLLAMIPLFTSSLTIDYFPESDATKSKGNSLTEVGSNKVCGDRLCSEIDGKPGNLQVSGGNSIEKQNMIKFDMPPYPNQPEVHPDLLAGYDYSNPPAVHKVTEGVYSAVGYDLANSIMITGDGTILYSIDYSKCAVTNYAVHLNENMRSNKFLPQIKSEIREKSILDCTKTDGLVLPEKSQYSR